MKKFFAVAALIVGISVAPSQAEAVRLCDYTLGDFIGRYNIVADGMNFPRSMRINSAPHYASSINYKGYTAYDISLGDSGHGVIFLLFTDQQGGVAELGWILGSEDEPSQVASVMVLFCSLFAAGLSEDEVKTLSDNMPSNGDPNSNMRTSVWSNSTGRRIYLTRTYAPNGRQGLTQVNLYAER